MNQKIDHIEAEALAELEEEFHRRAVEAAKARIRKRRSLPWWRRLLPFEITIRRI